MHPKFHGSWSIKKVAPVLASTVSYEELEGVSEGSEAEAAYIEAISPGVDADRKEKLRGGLLRYCKLDTECMYEIVRAVH